MNVGLLHAGSIRSFVLEAHTVPASIWGSAIEILSANGQIERHVQESAPGRLLSWLPHPELNTLEDAICEEPEGSTQESEEDNDA